MLPICANVQDARDQRILQNRKKSLFFASGFLLTHLVGLAVRAILNTNFAGTLLQLAASTTILVYLMVNVWIDALKLRRATDQARRNLSRTSDYGKKSLWSQRFFRQLILLSVLAGAFTASTITWAVLIIFGGYPGAFCRPEAVSGAFAWGIIPMILSQVTVFAWAFRPWSVHVAYRGSTRSVLTVSCPTIAVGGLVKDSAPSTPDASYSNRTRHGTARHGGVQLDAIPSEFDPR
jgi:hypothetical protein